MVPSERARRQVRGADPATSEVVAKTEPRGPKETIAAQAESKELGRSSWLARGQHWGRQALKRRKEPSRRSYVDQPDEPARCTCGAPRVRCEPEIRLPSGSRVEAHHSTACQVSPAKGEL